MSDGSSLEAWDSVGSTVRQALLPCLFPSLVIYWGEEMKPTVEKPKTNQKWTSSHHGG